MLINVYHSKLFNSIKVSSFNCVVVVELCDLDCGLHGHCVGDSCMCNPGWSGEYCNLKQCDQRWVFHPLYSFISLQQTDYKSIHADCSTTSSSLVDNKKNLKCRCDYFILYIGIALETKSIYLVVIISSFVSSNVGTFDCRSFNLKCWVYLHKNTQSDNTEKYFYKYWRVNRFEFDNFFV